MASFINMGVWHTNNWYPIGSTEQETKKDQEKLRGIVIAAKFVGDSK